MPKLTTIAVSPELKKRLEELPGKTMDEKIKYLLRVYERYKRVYVHQVMCNHFSSTDDKYLRGWYSILAKKLKGSDLIEEALSYLVVTRVDPSTGEPLLVVSKDKCQEKPVEEGDED